MNVPVTPVGHWYVCMHLFFSCYLQWNLQKFVTYHDGGDYFTISFFFGFPLIWFYLESIKEIKYSPWLEPKKTKKKKKLKQYTCREWRPHKTHYGKDSTVVEGHALYNKAVLILTGHTNPFAAIWLKLAFQSEFSML